MYSIEEFETEKIKFMKYILYKKRTEQEVKNKFQATCASDILYDMISYMKQAGYLNDEEYVKRAIAEYMALKHLSIREITYKLYTKGIKKDVLQDYMESHQEELIEYERKSAQYVVAKKQKTMEEEKLRQELQKKGYRDEIIKEVISCKTYSL